VGRVAAYPKDLTKGDFQIYCEECARMLSEGYTVERLARELNWELPDLNSLLSHRTFKTLFKKQYPEAFKTFQETEQLSLNVHNARDYAKSNVDDYVKQMDGLARGANQENVRYNALIFMMKMADVDQAAEVEIIELPSSHKATYAEATREVLEDLARRDSDTG
jgi:hypothetical protein